MSEAGSNQLTPRGEMPVAAAPDCWERIGVGGDRSCAELEQHIHCRNCPVYAEAGARLLDRALPPGYREEWAQRLAEVKTAAKTKAESVIIFRVGGETLALPTPVFQEVAERRVIRSLPHQRGEFILGLANVRGELLVCISLEHLLGVSGGASLAERRVNFDRLVVVRQRGFRLAFPVDKIFGVHRFHAHEIRETPGFIARGGPAFTRGTLEWDGQVVGLLDEGKIFAGLG